MKNKENQFSPDQIFTDESKKKAEITLLSKTCLMSDVSNDWRTVID